MVEEHVGKKRRKEVRQAITMSEELRKTLLLCIGLIVFGIVVLLVLFVISYLGLFEIPLVVTNTVPLVILVVLMIFVAPKANRYWALRDEYKAHLERYNISKDDKGPQEQRALGCPRTQSSNKSGRGGKMPYNGTRLS